MEAVMEDVQRSCGDRVIKSVCQIVRSGAAAQQHSGAAAQQRSGTARLQQARRLNLERISSASRHVECGGGTCSSISKAALSCLALPHASIAELNETIDGLAPAAFISPSTASASPHCLFFLYQRMRAL